MGCCGPHGHGSHGANHSGTTDPRKQSQVGSNHENHEHQHTHEEKVQAKGGINVSLILTVLLVAAAAGYYLLS